MIENPFKPESLRYEVAEKFLEGFSAPAILEHFLPELLEQKEPFIITQTTGGKNAIRVQIRPVENQIPSLWYHIRQTRRMLRELQAVLCPESEEDVKNYDDLVWKKTFFSDTLAATKN